MRIINSPQLKKSSHIISRTFYYILHPFKVIDYLVIIIMRLFFGQKVWAKFINYFGDAQFHSLKKTFRNIGEGSCIHYPWNAIYGAEYITIGKSFQACRGLYLGGYGETSNDSKIIIGNNVAISFDCQITATNKVEIGNNVLMGSRIFISDHSHGKINKADLSEIPIKRELFSKGPVIIGNNVWIGSGVAILPNVIIGDNCIIGANSVITKSFPANCVLAGNPAKIIKSL
jgi:acetyltransferase-like isoleucine patch superfamily enzyme